MSNQIHLDVIIINYNTRQLTCDCIDSICSNGISESNIIVVDNASTDDSVDYLSKNYPQVRIVRNDRNYGYAKAINIGVSASKADYYIISNSDVIYPNQSIPKLISSYQYLENPGVIAPQFINEDGTYQEAFSFFPSYKFGFWELTNLIKIIHKGYENEFERNHDELAPLVVDFTVGAVMLFSKKLFQELDGFCEDYFFYTEETDFCKRASQAGHLNYIIRNVKVKHLVGKTRETNSVSYIPLLVYTKRLFLKKHLSLLEASFYKVSQILKFFMLYVHSLTFAFLFQSKKTRVLTRDKAKEFIVNWMENYEDLKTKMKQKYGA
ncbi:MAG: glycosyltransferase family 2 protein [Candidatus Kapabacteria bacterium]|nr:glycosyltransferase family 2 protein [Candidatus Kapabacteria bacterium]